jgi:hypothetical protein
MSRVVGTCSVCGGAVTVPAVWCGVFPPTPTCSACGAEAASHGPVIPMKPRPGVVTKTITVPCSWPMDGSTKGYPYA